MRAAQDAMVSSHMLLTVSPSHAADILQEPSASFGLYDVLKSKGIRCAMPSAMRFAAVNQPLLLSSHAFALISQAICSGHIMHLVGRRPRGLGCPGHVLAFMMGMLCFAGGS